MTVALSLSNLDAHYGSTKVLDNLSLEIQPGELVSLLGASGCGKTTTLRLIAGFLKPTRGTIHLAGRDLTSLPAHNRDIGLVFQSYALFPHLTVRENVGFGLKQRKIPPEVRSIRVSDMLERVGLAELADRLPAALSGGQKQRVALARALVIEPPLLMFDEPLSNLDAKLRVDMRVEIRRLQQANGTTALYVTHDQEEAFSISDRVAIMNEGKIMQLDTPETLYRNPANAFVARFVGFENLLPMSVVSRNGSSVTAQTASGKTMVLDQNEFGEIPQSFVLATRADGLKVSLEPNGMPVKLGLRTYLGRAYQYRCASGDGELVANGPLTSIFESGGTAYLSAEPEQCCLLSSLS